MTSIAASAPSATSNERTVQIEELPEGWKTAKVTFLENGNRKSKIQIIDMRASPPMQYRHEPMSTISIKCALIIAALPICLSVNLLFHSVRTVVLVVGTLFSSVQVALSERTQESFNKLVVDWTWEAPAALLQGIRDFVKAPFCALDMALCSFYGIFSPLEGRILVGDAERRWRGSDRRYDQSRFKDQGDEFLTDLFTNRHSKKCHFIAYCFQPIGPLDSAQIKKVEFLEPHQKIVTHLD